MEIKRYFSNDNVPCKLWETLIEKYETDDFDVNVDFNFQYPDADVSIKKKAQLQDTLRSKGEPDDYRAIVRVQKHFGEIEDVTFYSYWLWAPKRHQLQVSSYELKKINEVFDYAGQVFGLDYCTKEDLPESEKDRIAFLGHPFDNTGQVYASKVSELLNLVGFEVLTGESFAPKKVSAKVAQRLHVATVVVIIFCSKKDLTWLVQEAVSESKDKPVLICVEEGTDWKPGLHGDIEYISFSADVSRMRFSACSRDLTRQVLSLPIVVAQVRP